jgi:hypothetical protein
MNESTPSNKFSFPTLGIITIAGLLVALAAIFVFNVAVGVVLNYAFFAVMILSHFWMHAGHNNHNGHQGHTNPSDPLVPVPIKNTDSQNRRPGCH